MMTVNFFDDSKNTFTVIIAPINLKLPLQPPTKGENDDSKNQNDDSKNQNDDSKKPYCHQLPC